MRKTIILQMALLLSMTIPATATEYYMSVDGDDANPGSTTRPFATLAKAASLLKAGDVLLVRSGTYKAQPNVKLKQSGTEPEPIRIYAADGPKAVLEFGAGKGPGITIQGAYWHIRGLVVTKAQASGIRLIDPNVHDVELENVTAWANGNTGFHLDKGVYNNTLLNCDSYENYDAPKHGQDADGFAAKHDIGLGNRFISCRAWNNSDDGFDCYLAGNAVTFENCYAWRNGIDLWKDAAFEGNGNGFKLGKLKGAHQVVHCAAWDQPQRGFDLNGNTSGVTIISCTAFRCKVNFYISGAKENIDKNTLRGNLSFEGPVTIDPKVDNTANSWNNPALVLTRADFQSLDPNTIEGPRSLDGSLPKSNFLHLTPESKAKRLGAFPE
jgi:hypothetical protein